MKLTCSCGASIEVDDIDPDRVSPDEFERRRASRRNNLNAFNENHAPCLKAWLEHCRAMSIAGAPLTRVTLPIDHPFVSHRIYDRSFLASLPPLSAWRAPMNQRGCEVPRPDAYARFRDALKEGKIVWAFDRETKRCYARCHDVTSFYPEQLMIESVDIPPRPTKEKLEEHGLELTGVCKVLQRGDLYWTIDDTPCLGPSVSNYSGDETYSGRRWIVKRKEQPVAVWSDECHAAAHDAIVRRELIDAVQKELRFFGGNKSVNLHYRLYDHAQFGDETFVPINRSRAVDLHIGQSHREIVKQARDLVQGMGITRKTKYVAWNIAGNQIIWGIK